MEWLGQAKIAFTHSPSPLKLKTKDGETTDLLRIAEESTPPCHLNPTLFNGHVQTMWTTTNKGGPELYFKRKVFEAEDPTYHGSFAVDFSCAPNDENDSSLYPRTTYFSDNEFESIGSLDSRPMLVTLHGLSGGSYEIYLRHVLAPLVGEGGWEACVVTSRGCARHNLTTPILYNARATWDTRQTVKWLRKTFPNRPLFGLGFSLGANIITNYIGEEGDACELKAAVVISSPWNLDVSNIALQRSWLGREVYSKAMAASLKKIFERQSGMMAQNPGLSMERIRKVTYLHEFDREVQTQAWGYPTESAYYRDASSCDALLAARIPVFAINATDDPIVPDEALPYQEFKQNPYAVLCTTSLGGHLSWFETGGGRWNVKPACNFLKKMASQIDLDSAEADFATANLIGPADKNLRAWNFDPIRRKLHVHGS